MKDNIMGVFRTMYEAHGIIRQYINDDMRENAYELLCDCQNTAVELGNTIYEVENDSFDGLHFFEEYCETVYQTAISTDISGEAAQSLLDEKLNAAEAAAEKIPAKLEVVFLPYKASMWDSLESIWRAADADPECNARVIPIPYYDRKPDHSFGMMHYEGKDFPDYVPITHYTEYDIESNQPDIIYIHNPYDDCNYVTSVAPEYYSFELRKHTPMLVYVLYYLSSSYKDRQSGAVMYSAYNHVDKIVIPTQGHKECHPRDSVPYDKFMVLGSPKIDYIVNQLDKEEIPAEWTERCNGRKVILMNSTIGQLLNDEYWCNSMYDLMKSFDDIDDCILLWRPHPLLKATVSSMRPDIEKEYDNLVAAMADHKNIIIDTNPSVYPAMKLSDALISDYSSIVMQYAFTGKPALLTVQKSSDKDNMYVCMDYFQNYFMEDGVTIKDFVDIVINDRDEFKNTRISAISADTANPDGSCGSKVHEEIKSVFNAIG
ncbi:MAG: CDP-glycerol glycerophosphotransferase family protein [Oscillospiraceae bacterium]|nr:CDP-glycerol glycerophosphotransferase family protein [Oscillospiraceae bacterium]